MARHKLDGVFIAKAKEDALYTKNMVPRESVYGQKPGSVQIGLVYAIEISQRSGRDIVNMDKKRTNVVPIIEDARYPTKYRMLVGMVYVIFSDVAELDQEKDIN